MTSRAGFARIVTMIVYRWQGNPVGFCCRTSSLSQKWRQTGETEEEIATLVEEGILASLSGKDRTSTPDRILIESKCNVTQRHTTRVVRNPQSL